MTYKTTSADFIREGEFPPQIQARIDAGAANCYNSIGKGWLRLVEELDRNITIHFPDYTIAQIKEKFGQLRFYPGEREVIMHEKVKIIIAHAEDRSKEYCEICGKYGQIVSPNGWMLSRCEDHIPAVRERNPFAPPASG